MNRKIRWGIMGAGKIVDRWIKGALQVEDMEICAIASRTEETARRAAQRWNIPCVMTYEQMASDDEIDVVYVAVPHTAHKELALLAMQHKKHVLVEKPAAVNAAQFAEMMQCAEENHVFLMEAVWTRFFPLMQEMKTLIRQGTIGDVRCVQASFCFRTADDDHSRLTDPAAAGGSLLDVGVYVLNFADLVYDKEPEKLMGLASINTDACHFQVDEQGAYIARYDRGELAVLQGAIRTEAPHTAWVFGTKGYIEMPVFWKPTRLLLHIDGKTEVITREVPQRIPGLEDEGYQFEVAFVNDCIRKGINDPAEMPHRKTMSVLRQMDQLRADWGLIYPGEKE